MNQNAASQTPEEKAEHGEAAPPTSSQQPRTIATREPHVPARAGRAAETTLSEDPPPSVGRASATERGRSAPAGPNGHAVIPLGGAHPRESPSPSTQQPHSTRHPCMVSNNSNAFLPLDENAWSSLPERATLEACGIGILGAAALPGWISSSKGPRQREALGRTAIPTGGAHLRKSSPPQHLTCHPGGLKGHWRDGAIAPAFQGHGENVVARQVAHGKNERCYLPFLPELPFQGLSTHPSPDNRLWAENTGGSKGAMKDPAGIGSSNESIGNDAMNLGGQMLSGQMRALSKVPEIAGSSFPVPTTSEARGRQGMPRIVKPGKASPEKFPPTSPDLRNEGPLPPSTGAHVKPSAVPEMEPATGPTMDSIEGSTDLTVDVADDTSPPMPAARDQLAGNIGEGSSGGRREHLLQQRPGHSLNEAETVQALAAGADAEAVGSWGDGRQGSSQPHIDESSLAVSVPFSAHVVHESSRSRMCRGRERMAMLQPVFWQSEPVYEGVVIPSHERGAHRESGRGVLKEHSRMIMAAVIIVVVLAVVVPTAVLMARPKSSEEEGSTLVPLISDTAQQATAPPSTSSSSWRFFSMKRELQTLMNSTALALEDRSSPQHRALVWLADEDARQVDWQDMLSLTQRFVLAMLFFATGGEGSWIKNCNFLSQEHECNWNIEVPSSRWFVQGAFCSGDNATIDGIIIAENNMTGELPVETSLLSSMVVLLLSRNKLIGPIPSRLGHLQQLIGLALEDNQLSGTIPPSLGGLTELQVLQLHLNELSGPIPTMLGKLSKLRDLWLAYNQLTGTIPVELNHLSKLEALFLDANFLNGTLPITAGSLQNLQLLKIGENNLSGTIPEALFTLQDLTSISYWDNALTGTLSPEFGKLTHLEVLQVSYNFLSGTLPPSLMGLSQLWALSLAGNAFTGTVPSEVSNLTTLQVLYLAGNWFGGTIPTVIGDLMELEELQLKVNQFTGHVPQSLTKLMALCVLSLENNSFTGDLDFLCNKSWVLFKADCHGDPPEIICNCCNACCSDELGQVGPVYGCFAT